jgi:hypothetical protein
MEWEGPLVGAVGKNHDIAMCKHAAMDTPMRALLYRLKKRVPVPPGLVEGVSHGVTPAEPRTLAEFGHSALDLKH